MRIAEINLDGDCNSCDYEGCINNKQWKNIIDDWYDYESSMKITHVKLNIHEDSILN